MQAGGQPILTPVKSLSYSPPQLTANAGAEAYIKPELQLLMFNVTGPYVNGKGYGRIASDTSLNPGGRCIMV